MKSSVIFIFILVFFISCKHEEGKKPILSENEIIEKCLAKLKEKEPNFKFIVSPKYNDFEFNSFIRTNFPKSDSEWRKDSTLAMLRWSEAKFKKEQIIVNKNYSGKYNFKLIKFSNSELSNSVLTFSGIHRNLIFVEIINYCNAVKPLDVTKEFLDAKHTYSDMGCINFVINGNQVEIVYGNGVVLEYQCNDTDIRIEN